MDKCFCHLNGFAVKDATARIEIANIKETYATKEYVDGKEATYTTLFDNAEGLDNNITLSDNITNYDYVEVYYQHGTCSHMSKSIAKNDVEIGLDGYIIGDESIFIQQIRVKINDNQLTKVAGKNGTIGNGTLSVSETTSIKVTRVVGIKL